MVFNKKLKFLKKCDKNLLRKKQMNKKKTNEQKKQMKRMVKNFQCVLTHCFGEILLYRAFKWS